MATTSVLALILILCLVLGWRHHFRAVEHRTAVIQLAQKADKARLDIASIPVNTSPDSAREPGLAPQPLNSEEISLRYHPNAPKVPATIVPEILPMANASSLVTEAEQIVNKYASAPSWQDKLQYVFEPERVRPLMEDYYDVQHNVDPVKGVLKNYGRLRMKSAEILQLNYASARESGKLELLLRRTRTNRLVIDWESFVGYCEKSFHELKRARPTTPVLIRGFVKLDDYYNYEFGDDKKFMSLKVTSADGAEFINVFCSREGEMAGWLFSELGGRPQDSLKKAYTLWISYPEGAQSEHCTNLLQIQAAYWIIFPGK